jgi:hypothetical protein
MIFSSGARQASTAIFARRQAYERETSEAGWRLLRVWKEQPLEILGND